MRPAALLLIVCCAAPVAWAEGTVKPWSVPGLELTEPQTRTKPGYAKVTAKVTAKDKDTKVKIKWKVRAQFEDADVEFDYEVRDEGKSVQVVIPDSRGLIEVIALAVIDGEPTEFAETSLSVEYKPRGSKDKPGPQVLPKEDAPKAEAPKQVKGKVKYVFFVQAEPEEPDPDIKQLINSVRVKNELKKLGVTPELLVVGSENFKKRNMADAVRRAGGAPCVVYVTDAWIVKKYAKLTAQTKVEDVLKEAGQ